MTTILMEKLQTGDVIEIKSGDDVITVLVLHTEELVEYRKFDADALFADA